jgi:hypothetical protein
MLELKASIPRGSNMELRIYMGEYYGKEVLDIRWYKETNGEMAPTRKGVRVNAEEAVELKQVLDRIMTKEEF